MYGDEKHGTAPGQTPEDMQCAQFEALLTEALDGTLTGAQLQTFEAHRAKCPTCAPMYAAAEAGLHWLKELHKEDVQPPARLMQNILRATSWADLPQKEAQRSWWQRLRELPGLKPVLGTVLQPRFAMTFAMAFCSISVLLTITGVNLRDLGRLDLHPSAVVRNVALAGGKVQKYYDNVKLVYEIESRVRDLKRATAPEEETVPAKPKPQKQNRSGRPQGDGHWNNSLENNRLQWAAMQGVVRREKGIWL